jgi:organic hydroperoxide reductase OsmC/OhrA
MREAKQLEFAVGIDERGTLYCEGRSELHLSPAWTPEPLLLAGLMQCTLASLRFHARQAGLAIEGRATSSGAITRRPTDGRFAFVEIHVSLDLTLIPPLGEPAVQELLRMAERDCFIGASLTTPPSYAWHVNGRDIETVAPGEMLARTHR